MRTFIPEPNTARTIARPRVATAPINHSGFHLQRTIGNRAVGQLLAHRAERSTDTAVPHGSAIDGGAPLSRSEREYFEPRFGHDFSDVRIHRHARADQLAHQHDALALTQGRDIFLRRDSSASGKPSPRRLLAHELAHVVQQRKPASVIRARAVTLEREADAAADAVERGEAAHVALSAPAGHPQAFRHRVGRREFEIGDVRLTNGQARTDVARNGVLFPGSDQAHVLVHRDKIGYEVAHTNPADPFRWQRFKDVVDNGTVDITAVNPRTSFPVLEVRGTSSQVVRRSLGMFMAGGITLSTLTRQQAIKPGASAYVASADANRDTIFYDSSQAGRGALGSNSLAHELFGHLFLAMQGSRYEHGQTVTAGAGIVDPFGARFAGPVDTYIDAFAASSAVHAIGSPTQGVGPALLSSELAWLGANGAGELIGSVGGSWQVTQMFEEHWQLLAANLDALDADPVHRADARELLARIVRWHRGLSPDQAYVFGEFLLASQSAGSGAAATLRRNRLAQRVSELLTQHGEHVR